MHGCLNNGTFLGLHLLKAMDFNISMLCMNIHLSLWLLNNWSIVPLTTQLAFISKSAVLNTKRVHCI